jgi:Protein of Unknown function (DUF2784)
VPSTGLRISLRCDSVFYRLLADLIVVVHLAYLVFIPVGGFLAWRWPRLVPIHLAAVAIALVSITIGFECPLTTWEQSLRRLGGQAAYTDGFIDHYLTGRVYPHGHDTLVQLVFGAAVLASYVGLYLRQRSRVSTRVTVSRHG